MTPKIEEKTPVTPAAEKAAPEKAAAKGGKPAANVTPEQQKQYDTVMVAARRTLFGDAGDDTRFKMVLERLSGAKAELASAIGSTTAVVMTNIAGTAKKQGRVVPPPILFHAGREVVADLVEIAVSASIAPKEQAAQLSKEALLEWVRVFKENNAGGPQAAPAAPGAPPAAAAPPTGIINGARAGALA